MKKKKKKKPSMHNTVTSSASLARRSLIIWHKIKQLSSMKSSKEKNNPLQCGLVLLHSTEREQQKAVQSMLCVTVHKLMAVSSIYLFGTVSKQTALRH